MPGEVEVKARTVFFRKLRSQAPESWYTMRFRSLSLGLDREA